MDKGKYNLSPEGVDKLMKRLEIIAQESVDESVTGLLEAQITTDFVKRMTLVKSLDDVIERNEVLSKMFSGFLALYGFETMYDMYVYAMSCDTNPEDIIKGKDYSKLVPVKRKVMRNGKETEVTVWEKPNKDDDKDDDTATESSQGSGAKRRGRKARDLKGKVIGGKDSTNPKQIATLKLKAKELKRGMSFKDTSDFYFTIQDDDGEVVGIIGYSEVGDYLTMDFYISNGEVSGVAARGFFELLKIAFDKGKGVKMQHNPQAGAVFAQAGLILEKGYWLISPEDLKVAFGQSGNEDD